MIALASMSPMEAIGCGLLMVIVIGGVGAWILAALGPD